MVCAGRGKVTGILTRYNKKTVTVVTDAGERWNVAPGLLRRRVDAAGAWERDPTVIPMRKKNH